MCDERTNQQAKDFSISNQSQSITQFSLAPPANALSIDAQEIDIPTRDGEADGYFVRPTSGNYPGVLIWTDILGMRASFRQIADRLAQSGYTVLVVNPYYRVARGAVVPEGSDFTQAGIPDIVVPLAMSLSSNTCLRDGQDFIAFLDQQPGVDTKKKIAVTGYCMTGSYPLRLAADIPERIGACASFHGNDMVTDSEDSPHLIIEPIQAGMLIVIAENDDEALPENKTLLREACNNAKVEAEIEIYADTLHGFCPPDSSVHHADQAEKAWQRQLALFEKQL